MNKFSVDPLQPGATLWPLIGGDDQSAYVCDILGNQTICCCQSWGFRGKNSLTGAVRLCEVSSKTASLVGHWWPGGVRIWQNDQRMEQWLSGNRVKWGIKASASAAQIAKWDHAAMQLVVKELCWCTSWWSGWPSACAWPTWGKLGTRVHYGRKHRQGDNLGLLF